MAITAVVTGNPFKITGTTTSANKVTDSEVMIQAMLWHKATTNAHLLSVTDKAGNQIWKAQMTTVNLGNDIYITFPLGLSTQDGIYVNDMDSGELYIYIK